MNKGIINIILASFFFSIINALVKYFDRIPALEIVFFRSSVSLILSYFFIRKKSLAVFNPHSKLLFARGLSGAIALSLYFYTIQKIPLATAVTILYLAPIFTIIIGIFLNKESPQKMQWPFIILTFIGTLLMKNFDPRIELIHFFMGLTAAFFAGLAYNIIRMLKGKADHDLIIFYFPLVTIPVISPFVITQWISPTFEELVGLIGIGVLTQIAQIFMTKAYTLEPAAKISHYNYLTSFYAFLTGIIFFDEYLNTVSIIGLIIVFFGIILTSRYAASK